MQVQIDLFRFKYYIVENVVKIKILITHEMQHY